MTDTLDPRVHPFRPDLAALYLQGRVEAERFAEGADCVVRRGFVGVRAAPDHDARQVTQLLFGETFTVYEERDGWLWGQNQTDGYVGWAQMEAFGPGAVEPTHRLDALRSYLFPEPDLKTPPVDLLSLGSGVRAVGERNGFVEIDGGGWLFAKHLVPRDRVEADHAGTALRLLGTPYLWGGRTSLGIDCSGLAQLALARAGRPIPRDSDQQREGAGTLVARGIEGVALRRGDLVFFPGHVGIMIDEARLVHSTAFAMAVVVEPLADVAARVDPTRGQGVLAVRRFG